MEGGATNAANLTVPNSRGATRRDSSKSNIRHTLAPAYSPAESSQVEDIKHSLI